MSEAEEIAALKRYLRLTILIAILLSWATIVEAIVILFWTSAGGCFD